MDIDGLNNGEDPFGYAIRTDGKIIYGARAQAWIKANINNNEEYLSTIATINTCTPTSLSITPENDVCKVIQQPVVTPTPEPEPTCTPSEHCIECNPSTGACLVCEDRYKLDGDECVAKAPCEDVDCGELAMCIELSETKGICMTKYNIGDKAELPIASGVTIATAGVDTCTPSESNFCCWQGTTSAQCDSENGDYSGCTRTTCDWRAANKSCNSLTYLSKSWRLPTNEEWTFIGNKINETSIGQGANGLMLCDYYSGYSSARCRDSYFCPGSYTEECDVNDIWSETSDSANAYEYALNSGAWSGPFSVIKSYAFSARCVSDL